MNAYIAAKERSGMVPGGDMVVVAGDINVDRHGDEYRDMLGALSLTVPDASLGWPYSYDAHSNTIGKIRDGTGAPRAVARVLARLGDTEDDAVAQVRCGTCPGRRSVRRRCWNGRSCTGWGRVSGAVTA
ncbi:hypothetical protein [Streptomyces sp. NPDC050804]|uniref:hypothetical protein n=1 Tax=Streptomyces sp. NPDC050804 TaxID=3154745 RepID=UPI00341A5E99